MLLSSAVAVWALYTAAAAQKGYPLFVGSFADLGKPRSVDSAVQSVNDVDDLLTDWLEPCKADAFLVIRDSTPFDAVDLNRIKRLGEQSLTVGSFLSDYPLNVGDLAEELAEHCGARYQSIDIYEPNPLAAYVGAERRVFYVDFDHRDEIEKNHLLTQVLQAIPSPWVTVIYSSTFPQSQPVFANVKLDPRRQSWHEPDQRRPVAPTVAPLRSPRQTTTAAAPEPLPYDIPEGLFEAILWGSATIVVLLIVKNAFI